MCAMCSRPASSATNEHPPGSASARSSLLANLALGIVLALADLALGIVIALLLLVLHLLEVIP